ncbi:MAG: hypothetical protein ABWZ42_05075 [Ilumatobacteraceae bacterium]
MTLLDDLQALDLSSILDAKADIAIAVNGDDLLALVGDGAATSVLGDIGTALQTAVDGFRDPSALVEPILSALTAVLGEIDGDIALDDYVEAVTAAARIVADLVGMISGDPNRIGFGGGLDIGGALERVGGQFGDHAAVVSGNLARFRALVQSVEQGLPSDPAAIIGPALEILVPFSTGSIDVVRAWALQLSQGLDQVVIDPRLTEGLIASLGQVRVAADAGDMTALTVALTTLAEVRANTIQQLAAALRRVAGVVSGIRVEVGADVVGDLRVVLANAGDTVFELLDGWRDMIVSVEATVGSIDAEAAMEHATAILDQVEATARDIVLGGVDGSVEVVKQWLRDLLREVPIRALRMQLSESIASAARAIADADLDAPIDSVRGLLTDVSSVLTDADPAALIQGAVVELEQVISDTLDQLESSLGQITQGINDVAAQAESVLSAAVDGLRGFREVVDEITVAIDNAGIVDAAGEIATTLDALREQVSELLSDAPIPDALREGVEQLISTIESIDLDAAIGNPLREVAAKIQIPPEVATTVRDGLEAIVEAVTSLVPDDVIADLESMMADALAEIQNLDISSLTSGVTGVLDDAAGVFDQVRIAELMAPASDVFAEIVEAVDRVHPRVVLRPVIDLYGQILGAIPLPEPSAIAERAGTVTSQAGESVARAAAEPARQAVGSSATTPPAGSTASPAREDQPDDLRPGDVVRLIGFLPAKLREALIAVGTGPAGEVLAAIDGQFTECAAALRDVRDRILVLEHTAANALDVVLAPVAAAQVDAQLALQGSTAFSVGNGMSVDVSLSLVASVGPAALEHELDGERGLITQRSRIAGESLAGNVAHDLDEVADLLESVFPDGLFGDVDALLAALDPEPIAAALDSLLAAVVEATPAFLAAASAELGVLEARVRALIREFNPGTLMQRYLGVLDVVREELALLDPGRLADELGEIHAEVKAALLAYDPLVLAADLDALIAQVAAAIRGLDPSGLMPDLSGIAGQVARVGDILPVNALADVGTQLTAVGEEIRALDVQAMLDAINAITPEIAEAITLLVDAVRDEIVALLESIRFSSSSGSASVSVSVGVG